MYKFLLSGKWIGAFALCILFSLICVYLAGWQMDRKEALDYRNSRISQNYNAEPESFDEAGKYFSDYSSDKQWTPISMKGTYHPEDQKLVRNRPHDGSVGFEVLVPFTTTDGHTVLIDRGWVGAGDSNASPASAVPPPPAGEVDVTARLQEGEADTGKDAPEGQIASINLKKFGEQLSYPMAESGYGIMSSEDPAPATSPSRLSEPEQDAGPNLSYSMQWYAFAILVYVAYAWCARQKVRNDRLDAQLAAELDVYYGTFYDEEGRYIGDVDESIILRQMEMMDDMPSHMKAIVRPKPQKKRKRVTDEELEDAYLDAAEEQRFRK
ncbi:MULTISPECIES: SURF1 family cytochrome oxidase biogenesis protein [Micrococcaceae]|uniref:SURF1 family cytochrome oxidase biogenesis protein n=1 Tax=unclassified Kocuria TaxID=2649579 RepID=UPI001EDEDD0D|nr:MULTISPECIES: SURF1 family protein [unclassified Kocuria]